MATTTLYITGNDLTPDQLYEIATGNTTIEFSEATKARVKASRQVIDDIVNTKDGEKQKIVYGVNTGFGQFSDTVISTEKLTRLQENLIRSHAAGMGEPLEKHRTRMLVALRINVLCKGFSGIAMENLEKMRLAFNADCIPVVPKKGTVGASGDLAPLAHVALGLMGEGKMWTMDAVDSKPTGDAAQILKSQSCESMKLAAKEGLALINGTQFISALSVEALVRAEKLFQAAIIVAAISIEALLGTSAAFDPEIHAARPHVGQNYVATFLRRLLPAPLKDPDTNKYALTSELKTKKGPQYERVQDAYTSRCTPQVYGVAYDTMQFVRRVLTTEINAATDNPMVFTTKQATVSGGNFHGEYPAKMADFLAISIAEVASMSERRIDRMMNPSLNQKSLPMFLVNDGGLNSGFMITHCTAAALVSENKVLLHPASGDSIPTNCGQEDHVSMGGYAARKALDVVTNVEIVVALELYCACQAMDLHGCKTTKPLQAVIDLVRSKVPFYDKDRVTSVDQEKILELLRSGEIVESVKKVMTVPDLYQ